MVLSTVLGSPFEWGVGGSPLGCRGWLVTTWWRRQGGGPRGEAIIAIFAMLWGPSNSERSTDRFQPLFTALSRLMTRPTHYLRYSGAHQIQRVDPNHYLQHLRVQSGDPHTVCDTLAPLQFEESIPITIHSILAAHEAIQTLFAILCDPNMICTTSFSLCSWVFVA